MLLCYELIYLLMYTNCLLCIQWCYAFVNTILIVNYDLIDGIYILANKKISFNFTVFKFRGLFFRAIRCQKFVNMFRIVLLNERDV